MIMARDIDLYEALKPHIGEEGARLIAEAIPPARELVTKADIDELRKATKADINELSGEFTALSGEFTVLRGEFTALRSEFTALRGEFKTSINELRLEMKADIAELKAETRHWMMSYFVPLWLGVYGTLAALILTNIAR
jgi:hypothetical protein